MLLQMQPPTSIESADLHLAYMCWGQGGHGSAIMLCKVLVTYIVMADGT